MRYVLAFLLLGAAPAGAHDGWGTRVRDWPDVQKARAEARLCMPQLIAVVERQRSQANEQALNQFGRVANMTTTSPTPAQPPQ
jgi:hypothetical protein